MDLAFFARISTHMEKLDWIEQHAAGHLKQKVKVLKDEMIGSKEIAEKLIKEIKEWGEFNRKEVRKLEEKVDKLEEKIRSLEEEIKILKEDKEDSDIRVVRLEGIIFKQDEQIAQRVEQYEVKLEELHEMKLNKIESALHTGQIAFDFEKDLATYIYPPDKKIGSRKIFTSMKKWLEEKKDTPQGSEANEKWNALQNEFSWSVKHEQVFFKLLEFRKQFAHPIVDRNKAQSQISDDFTDEEKMLVKDIVRMTDRVNELMQ